EDFSNFFGSKHCVVDSHIVEVSIKPPVVWVHVLTLGVVLLRSSVMSPAAKGNPRSRDVVVLADGKLSHLHLDVREQSAVEIALNVTVVETHAVVMPVRGIAFCIP